MPNDAKLGLVVGLALVIAVAVVFFRKDVPTNPPAVEDYSVQSGSKPAGRYVPPSSRKPFRQVKATAVKRTEEPAENPDRQHTVVEGDTLYNLAQRYYGDGDKFIDLFRANREVLKSPDSLPPGTLLVIPNVPRETAPAAPDKEEIKEEPKPEEAKVVEPKTEEAKPEDNKPEETKPEEPKREETKPEDLKGEQPEGL